MIWYMPVIVFEKNSIFVFFLEFFLFIFLEFNIYKKNQNNKIFVYLTNGSEWQMDGMCQLKLNQT